MEKDKKHIALKYLPTAKNCVVDKSKIYGGVEMDGENNRITRSLIEVKKSIKENPIKSIFVGLVVVILGLIIEYYFFQ